MTIIMPDSAARRSHATLLAAARATVAAFPGMLRYSAGAVLYDLLRPHRLRRAVRRYEHHLAALRQVTVPCLRANKLDLMALVAEHISCLEIREPQTQAWGTTADLLRAIAASERFAWLTDVYLRHEEPVLTGAEFCGQWEALAAAAIAGDRRERAVILRGLCGEGTGREIPGVLVLDDIAETEDVVALRGAR